jgi:hypothetical protein
MLRTYTRVERRGLLFTDKWGKCSDNDRTILGWSWQYSSVKDCQVKRVSKGGSKDFGL